MVCILTEVIEGHIWGTGQEDEMQRNKKRCSASRTCGCDSDDTLPLRTRTAGRKHRNQNHLSVEDVTQALCYLHLSKHPLNGISSSHLQLYKDIKPRPVAAFSSLTRNVLKGLIPSTITRYHLITITPAS